MTTPLRSFFVACATAVVLAGCGVGLGVEIGPDDDPPSVTILSSQGVAAPGQAIRLSGDARDDGYVDEVAFYRIDPDGRSVYLGNDFNRPFELNALIPTNAPIGSSVNFFARAYDNVGQRTDSAPVTITVQAATPQ